MILRVGLCVGIVSALLVGCGAFSAVDPFSGEEYETLSKNAPLPFAVSVSVDIKTGQPPAAASGKVEAAQGTEEPVASIESTPLTPRIGQKVNEEEVLNHVVQALEKFETFSVLTNDRSVQPDLELIVEVTSPADTGAWATEETDMIWVNLPLWLLLGAPAWFIADTKVNQGVTMAYHVVPGEGMTQVQMGKADDLSGESTLNFIRRADLLQYLYQILIPPFLLSPDPDVADQSLYENYLSRMQRDLGRLIKQDFYRFLVRYQFPILIVVEPKNGRETPLPTPDLDAVLFVPGVLNKVEIEPKSVKPTEPKVTPYTELTEKQRSTCEQSLGENADLLKTYEQTGEIDVLGADLSRLDREAETFLRLKVHYTTPKNENLTWTQTIRLPAPSASQEKATER